MVKRLGKFAGDDPFKIAQKWLRTAESSEPNDPSAVALATCDADGMPNVRMVLIKEIDSQGFVFYTNYESAKAEEIAASPKAAFVMHWKTIRCQIRVRGSVEKIHEGQADVYFALRSLQSKLGAWASKQSRPLASKAGLMAAVAKATARHGTNPARPPFWGGYRIVPDEIEFWADGAFRLHDRFLWQRKTPEHDWKIQRLYP